MLECLYLRCLSDTLPVWDIVSTFTTLFVRDQASANFLIGWRELEQQEMEGEKMSCDV